MISETVKLFKSKIFVIQTYSKFFILAIWYFWSSKWSPQNSVQSEHCLPKSTGSGHPGRGVTAKNR